MNTFSRVLKQLQKTEQLVKKTKLSINKVELAAIDEIDSQVRLLEDLYRTGKTLRTSTEQGISDYEKLEERITEVGMEANNIAEKVSTAKENLNRFYSDQVSKEKDLKKQLQIREDDLKTFNDEQQELEDELDKVIDDIDRDAQNLRSLGSSIAKAISDTDSLLKEIAKAASELGVKPNQLPAYTRAENKLKEAEKELNLLKQVEKEAQRSL